MSLEKPSFTFFDSKVKEIINNTLKDFEISSDCCIEFPKYFINTHRMDAHNSANIKNFKTRNHQKAGLKYVKVYKNTCNSYPGNIIPFKLCETSEKLIFKFLKDSPLNQKERLDIFPYYAKTSSSLRPKVPIYRFCVGTIHNSMLGVPPQPLRTDDRLPLPIQNYKIEILNAIEENRILIISDDNEYEKSTEVPQFIIEDSCKKNLHCRIISAHSRRISAIRDSEMVASQRGERMGITVGFQIRLESMSSTTTNLLYTTTSFFLRCLMGNATRDFFNGITHIIVNDVHEREPYCDLLLLELKEILTFYPSLKIILMCCSANTRAFEEYFKPAKLLELKKQCHEVSTYHLDQILTLTQYVPKNLEENSNAFKVVCDPTVQYVFDSTLDTYMQNGNDNVFDYILYLFKGENLPLSAQHSKTGITPLMAATRNNQLKHVIELLQLKVNPFVLDFDKISAIEWGKTSRSTDCVQYLNNVMLKLIMEMKMQENCISQKILTTYEGSRLGTEDVDHELLFELINYINDCGEAGDILVFLPSYEDLIKQQCIINKKIMFKNMKPNVKLYLLHENILDTEIKKFADDFLGHRKIILSTDVAETAFCVQNIKFVIDSGRRNLELLNANETAQKSLWITKESMNRRTSIAGRQLHGYSFRLYSESTANTFTAFEKPGLLNTSIHKICLNVKLLSQYTSIKDYFLRAIQSPAEKSIEDSLHQLKCIGVLDEQENVTVLGTRLVDIPVDLQLGKVLIFAIVLRCLDPVLTIVSALSYKDPLVVPDELPSRKKVMLSRKNLAECTNSDHMVLLRAYQKWQDERTPEVDINLPLEKLILNGLLEAICGIRTQIIGALRAAGLIHSSGYLSMQSLNINANNWALVKGCFIGGMYPNICRIDKAVAEIKSKQPQKFILHPSSVLRDIDPLSVKKYAHFYQTDWIIFQEKLPLAKYSSIKCNSIVSPVSIALLGGDIQMIEDDLDYETEHSDEVHNNNVLHLNIDEWISLPLYTQDAYLLFYLRQKFFCFFREILQLCSDPDKFRKSHQYFEMKSVVVDVVSKVISLEERAHNFPEPNKVGERPKALPLKFAADANFVVLQEPLPAENQFTSSNGSQFNENFTGNLNTRFYILKVASKSQAQDYFNRRIWTSSYSAWQHLVQEYSKFPGSHIVVFLLINDSKLFCAAGQMCSNGNDFFLKKLAQVDVPLYNLEAVYRSVNENFEGCFEGIELPRLIGEQFFTCFMRQAHK